MTSEEGLREKRIKELAEKCSDALNTIELFYREPYVNYSMKIRGIPYTECVAGFVLQHLDSFKRIPMITREKSYDSKHTGLYDPNSPRIEELDAMKMFNQCRNNPDPTIGDAGHVIDYQVPLKNKRSDNAGKIDLLTETDDTVYVLELKKEESKETLLRCVLEGYTYLKTVNKEKLFRDYGINPHKPLKTAPLIYENSRPGEEYLDMINGNRPKLNELMRKLDVAPFLLTRKDNTFYSKQCKM